MTSNHKANGYESLLNLVKNLEEFADSAMALIEFDILELDDRATGTRSHGLAADMREVRMIWTKEILNPCRPRKALRRSTTYSLRHFQHDSRLRKDLPRPRWLEERPQAETGRAQCPRRALRTLLSVNSLCCHQSRCKNEYRGTRLIDEDCGIWEEKLTQNAEQERTAFLSRVWTQ